MNDITTCPKCGNDNCNECEPKTATETQQRFSSVQLSEMDAVKNDVYAIINQGARGVLIDDFEAAKEVCGKIAEYIMKQNSIHY